MHRARQRADLIERRAEREQAVARHAAVGRLEADARRRAPPAGGSSRRCPSRARAAPCPRRPRPPIRRSIRRECDRAPTDCATGRTPSSRSTSPSRTRRSWSCRRSTAPAASRRDDDRRVVGRHERFEDRDEAVVRTPRVQRLSLSATGRRRAARRASGRDRDRSSAARASASSRVTVLNACSDRLGRRRSGRAPRGRPRPPSARPIGPRRGCRDVAGRSSDDPRHFEEAARPARLGTVASGALASASSAIERRPDLVGAIGVVARRRRWPSAARRSCRSAAPRRRTRGCRRAGARTARLRRRRARDARARRWLRPALA